jgi:arsenite methyltransferase
VLWGECVSGALYINDFKRLAREAGFLDQRVLHRAEIAIQVGATL